MSLDLVRALPRDAVEPGIPVSPPAVREVRAGDGTWIYAEVIAQARDRGGGWRVQLRWYGTDDAGRATQLEDWYLHDPAAFRDPDA